MAKLPGPLSTLTTDAKAIYDKITAKRGPMRGGPYASLMHDPALAEKVGDLGEYLRFGGTLPGDIRELAILVTARSVNQAAALCRTRAAGPARAGLRVDPAATARRGAARVRNHRADGAGRPGRSVSSDRRRALRLRHAAAGRHPGAVLRRRA